MQEPKTPLFPNLWASALSSTRTYLSLTHKRAVSKSVIPEAFRDVVKSIVCPPETSGGAKGAFRRSYRALKSRGCLLKEINR